jgi:hypothetical protein
MNSETEGKRYFNQLENAGVLMFHNFLAKLRNRGENVTHKITHETKEKAEELTEEAILKAVDQAMNVIELAGKRFRERDIPAEQAELAVGVSIGGVLTLNVIANVPQSGEIEDTSVDVMRKKSLN